MPSGAHSKILNENYNSETDKQTTVYYNRGDFRLNSLIEKTCEAIKENRNHNVGEEVLINEVAQAR